MSGFLKQTGCRCAFAESGAWVVLSEIEQSIKKKIEAVGRPLKDWDINIYRGILTGYNDAFIITTEKRNEILSNCKDDEERSKTCEIIRPILRGRDIKRYGYDWANLWLINTHNGVKGKIPRIDINDYPAIKAHLDQYWDKIKDRADQGDTPYNLRNCAYLEDFGKPKIVWGEISDRSKFALDRAGQYVPEATTFLLVGSDIEYLCCVLNSAVAEWYFSLIGTTTGVGTIRWKKYTIEKLPIPICDDEIKVQVRCLMKDFYNGEVSRDTFSTAINALINKVLLLDTDEVEYIEKYTHTI